MRGAADGLAATVVHKNLHPVRRVRLVQNRLWGTGSPRALASNASSLSISSFDIRSTPSKSSTGGGELAIWLPVLALKLRREIFWQSANAASKARMFWGSLSFRPSIAITFFGFVGIGQVTIIQFCQFHGPRLKRFLPLPPPRRRRGLDGRGSSVLLPRAGLSRRHEPGIWPPGPHR
jgi:hypothetical protein